MSRSFLSLARAVPRLASASGVQTSFIQNQTFRAGRYASTNHPSSQREAQKDREKMDTQPNEYSKSGTDAASADQSAAAFDPNVSNDPEEAKKEAGKGNKVNPLEASPANPDLSHGTSEAEGGAGKKKGGGSA